MEPRVMDNSVLCNHAVAEKLAAIDQSHYDRSVQQLERQSFVRALFVDNGTEVIAEKPGSLLVHGFCGPQVVTWRKCFYDFSQRKPEVTGLNSSWSMSNDDKDGVHSVISLPGSPALAARLHIRVQPLSIFRRCYEDRIRKDPVLCYKTVV